MITACRRTAASPRAQGIAYTSVGLCLAALILFSLTPRPRLVLDTNALISRLLLPASVPGRAVAKAVDKAQILASEDLMFELAEVLSRAKFDPYLSLADRQEFLRVIAHSCL